MKYLYLSLIIIVASSDLFAQTEKGNFILGGSFSYHYHQQNNPDGSFHKDHGISAYPTFGIFFKDTWAAGTQLIFAYNKSVTVNPPSLVESIREGTSYGARLFLKKYFLLNEKVAFTGTAEGSAEKGTSNSNWSSIPAITRTNYNMGIRPGFSYFITKKLGLEANIGYLGFNYGRDNDGNANITQHKNFYTQFNPGSIFFGMNFFL